MIELIKSNALFVVVGLLGIKYIIQFYFSLTNRKQKIVFRGRPFVSAAIIWMLAIIVFSIFIFQNRISNYLFGFISLILGITIGIFGLINLNRNFHDNLVSYENSILVRHGIYSIVRHPIRLGICLETFALVLFINSVYIIPLFVLYLYLNYKRTISEEEFLTTVFKEEILDYFIEVPKFNIIKGILIKLRSKFKSNFQTHFVNPQ